MSFHENRDEPEPERVGAVRQKEHWVIRFNNDVLAEWTFTPDQAWAANSSHNTLRITLSVTDALGMNHHQHPAQGIHPQGHEALLAFSVRVFDRYGHHVVQHLLGIGQAHAHPMPYPSCRADESAPGADRIDKRQVRS
jgi:hypothetical protein